MFLTNLSERICALKQFQIIFEPLCHFSTDIDADFQVAQKLYHSTKKVWVKNFDFEFEIFGKKDGQLF